MTIPKWLLPVISIVVALAVGVAAVIVSGRFVPADRVESNVETETTTTTLWGPSGYGDEDLTELPETALGTSPEVGTIEVSTGLPDDPGVTPLEDAVERIADGGAAGDAIPAPVDETTPGAAAGDEPSEPAEDPCIAAGDCPDGTVMGRIFALVSPPEMVVRVRAFAPAELCRDTPAGGMSLLVFMSRPADIHVTVQQTAGGGAIQSFDRSTDPGLEATWNTALADAESDRDPLPLLYFCLPVTGLEPGTLYQAFATAEARDGTTVTDSTEFNGAGPTHHPTLSIEPIGDGAAVAYTENRPDEQVGIRAWILPDDYPYTPDCFGAALNGFTEIPWRYRDYGELTAAQTGDLLIPPDNTVRTAYGFPVPEGSTILFCAAWHPGSDAPSWERAQTSYADGAILRTTDYVLPKVTLVRVDPNPDLSADEITVYGRTQEGMQCGGFSFDPDQEASVLPHVVCELDGASIDFSAREWSFRDVGFTGNIVIPMRVTADGEEHRSDETLNIGDQMCIGGCPSNPTTRYTIPLPEVSGESFGTITLQVSWEQGASNGLVRPVVTDVPQRDGLEALPADGVLDWATPMMDTDERMSYLRPDATTLSGVAGLHLVTDRPVDYEITLTGLAGDDCAVGGATLSTTGHSDGEKDVEVNGLCFGHLYWATVVLTDESGNSTTFSYSRGGVTQWLASLVRVPKAEVRVEYAAVATTPADSAIVPGSYLKMDGAVIPLGARTCTDDGRITSHGVVVVPLTSHPVIDVRIATVPELTNDGVYCSGILAPDAITVVAEGTFELDLASIREASGGTTVTIGGLTFVVTILA